ncbi:DUF6650 family protein [Streptomyces sp. NPDC058175]|uniref:DUF6650 family protein n=1 Tax=Streptomyces sp. NPDC058175 TaxID=3346367 RepID=UPI0036EFCFA4
MNLRLTSFNVFGVGITWEFTEKDRVAAQRVMNFLADRRILRVGRSRPQVEAEKCLRSAHECRARLSELLDRLDEPGSDLNKWLAAIRHGFNEFIEECERQDGGKFGPGSEVKFNEAPCPAADQGSTSDRPGVQARQPRRPGHPNTSRPAGRLGLVRCIMGRARPARSEGRPVP